jgi:hypothetical protein
MTKYIIRGYLPDEVREEEADTALEAMAQRDVLRKEKYRSIEVIRDGKKIAAKHLPMIGWSEIPG